jgi:hypothetical protein
VLPNYIAAKGRLVDHQISGDSETARFVIYANPKACVEAARDRQDPQDRPGSATCLMLREPLVRGGGDQQREDSIARLADRATIPELCLFSRNRRKSFSSANVNSKLYGQPPCSDLEVLYLDDHCCKEAVLRKFWELSG